MSLLSKIKAFLTPEFEPSNKQNANNSRYLSFGQIALFILGLFLPLIVGKTGIYNPAFFIVELLLLVSTIITAIGIGFHNTFETNDDYKTGVQVASGIAGLIVPLIFIVSIAS